MPTKLRIIRLAGIIFCAALLVFATFLTYRTSQRSEKTAHIQTQLDSLKVRQAALKTRFDALLAEFAKAPNDPVLLKRLGGQHLQLVKEEDAIKRELGDLQNQLDANRR